MRTYGAVVEDILWRAGLPADTERPDGYAARLGLEAAWFRYAGDGEPSCYVELAAPAGGAVRGRGWGATGRAAFLAAVADAIEPGS